MTVTQLLCKNYSLVLRGGQHARDATRSTRLSTGTLNHVYTRSRQILTKALAPTSTRISSTPPCRPRPRPSTKLNYITSRILSTRNQGESEGRICTLAIRGCTGRTCRRLRIGTRARSSCVLSSCQISRRSVSFRSDSLCWRSRRSSLAIKRI